MDNNEKQAAIFKAVSIENIFTMFAAALCVGLLAIGTGSLIIGHGKWEVSYEKVY